MSQKIIIVTGANKGIGLEIVRDLARTNKNALLIGTSRNQNDGDKAIENLKQTGVTNVKYEILDLNNSHSIEHFARSITSKYDHIDVLVNNAAVSPAELKATPEMVDNTLRPNFYGLVELTEKLLPLLKKSKEPRIVNVGSRAGNLEPFSKTLQDQYLNAKTTRDVFEIAYAFEVAAKHNDYARLGYAVSPVSNPIYAASKALVHAYTAVLPLENPEIFAASFCPGPVQTDMSRALFSKLSPEQLIPLKELYKHGNTPTEAAETAVFLINTEKKQLVNGGFYAEKTNYSRVNAPFPPLGK